MSGGGLAVVWRCLGNFVSAHETSGSRFCVSGLVLILPVKRMAGNHIYGTQRDLVAIVVSWHSTVKPQCCRQQQMKQC